jgi:pimeloyl-ACP methyl ester carboxylesterase
MLKVVLIIVGCAVGGLWLLEAAVGLIQHVQSAAPAAGRREGGLVLFVEGIRWLGVQWDKRSAQQGLAQAGYQGRLEYWQWHQTWRAMLVVPALADRAFLRRRARELADRISQERAEHPDAPLYLFGVSAGCAVSVAALELLPDGVSVDGVALLSGAVCPWHDLSAAMAHINGKLVVTASLNDWLVLGLGTIVVGTGDQRHSPSMGMIGPRGKANERLRRAGRLVVLKWRPGMIRWGNLGGHFSAASPKTIARLVAPQLIARGP